MIFSQSNFLQALGWAVLNSLWQMAFLWVIFQLISGIFRNTSSSQKSALASSLVIIGFTWFVYTFFLILTSGNPGNGAIASGIIISGNNEQLNDWLHMMLPIASLVYLALLILPVFYFIRNYRYVQAIRQYKLSKVNVEWRIFVKNVAARIGIQKPVQIWLSGIVTSPVTIGYIKPIILLPLAAVNHLSPQQIEAILLHELAHIRRYDYFINLLLRFIQTILYFNPFVKALVKIVEREREKSCDEMVMQFQYDPYGYASALLTLEKTNQLPKPLAVAASGKKNDLLHRIECLLGVQKRQVFSFNKLAGLFAGLLCFIALNALLILSKPVKNPVATLTHLSSPFYFFTETEEGTPGNLLVTRESQAAPLVNQANLESAILSGSSMPEAEIGEKIRSEIRNELTDGGALAFTSASSPFMNVAFTELAAASQLKNYQEAQVKETVEACKKVLEDKQWKAVENKIAEVMTRHEKGILKDEYEKELSKVDWNKMEDKLRLVYDKINWNEVNDALNKAMVEIRIDSLQQVYSTAMNELSSLQQQLCENNIKSIPDTDISLKSVEQNKRNVQRAITTLNKVKTRKIIHL